MKEETNLKNSVFLRILEAFAPESLEERTKLVQASSHYGVHEGTAISTGAAFLGR
jgi:hypothetical protein